MEEQSASCAPESVEYELIALARRVKCSRPAPSPITEGLTHIELHALMMLARGSECRISVKPSDIAHRFRVSPSAVSQFLKSLEQKGFIIRTRAKGDSRSVVIELTEKGTAFSMQIREERRRVFAGIIDAVGMQEMQQFVATLRKICDYMDSSDEFVSVHRCPSSAGKGAPCA